MDSTNYETYKKDLLKNESVRIEYEKLEEEFILAKEVMELRKEKNLTQTELAKEVGTSQPAIARLESGNYKNLSLKFLRKVAEALGAVPEVHIKKKVG
ncbi:helix-turn-helix domain-containing protein [Spirochaeta lutea]|nr:helix-turn-helix transcriptional regulator [Spirochaeta lutea]